MFESPSDALERERDSVGGMRAYLQRAEVRLSTMHRVAGSFLSGAGLLVLLPFFLRDVFIDLVREIFIFDYPDATVLLFCLSIVLIIPVYALYLLFRDLVEFYFVSEHPGWKTNRFYPRFVLSGISISKDELNAEEKRVQIELLRDPTFQNFVLSRDSQEVDYLTNIATRHDVTHLSMVHEDRVQYIRSATIYEERDLALWTKYGLTNSIDLTLLEEVSKSEASLVRHAFLLRRLVLRYAKALLIFVMTTLVLGVLFALLTSRPFIDDSNARLACC